MTNIFHSKCKWPVVKSRENFDTHSIIKTYQIKFYLTWYDGLSWNLDRLAIIWIIFLKKISVIWWIIQLFFFLELYHFFLWEVCQRIIVGKRIPMYPKLGYRVLLVSWRNGMTASLKKACFWFWSIFW